MYLDENGIAHIEDTDPVSPLPSLINPLQAATSEALTTLRDDLREEPEGWPYRRVRTATTLDDETTTVLQWVSDDSGEAIPGGLGYSNGVFTAQTNSALGLYAVDVSIGGVWPPAAIRDFRVFINRTGTRVMTGAVTKGTVVNTHYMSVNASVVVPLQNIGDDIQVVATQRSGSNLTLDDAYSKMTIAKIRNI